MAATMPPCVASAQQGLVCYTGTGVQQATAMVTTVVLVCVCVWGGDIYAARLNLVESLRLRMGACLKP